jgi:hypothetical protein
VSVFSDQRVIDFIAEHFVPVTTDINLSQHRKDADGKYFRKIAEQGHYAGRTKPTATRQGLYVATTDGHLLASVNSARADDVMKMMKQGVAKWQQRQALGMVGSKKKVPKKTWVDKNYSVPFPQGGMILREVCRDLPRPKDPSFDNWRHNFDNVWLTGEEVAQFKPVSADGKGRPKLASKGQKYEIDQAVISRLAQFHFVDQVKGEASSWDESDIKQASLNAEVIEVADDSIKIKLSGRAKCVKPPTGNRNPYSGSRIDKERGVDLKVTGYLVYDSEKDDFNSFELVAHGARWGGATYNFRKRDMGPEPIGFAFRLLEKKPENMTQPKFLLWGYFDK